MTKKKNKRLISYIYLGINTICWGAALIIVKPAFEHTTPFRFLFYRYFFSVLFSLPILIYFLFRVKNVWKKIKIITAAEFIGTVLTLTLLYLGLQRTSAIETSLITTTTPVFISLAGIFFLKEKQEKHEWFGLLLAFFGTLSLAVLPILKNGQDQNHFSLIGNLLVLSQNICIAAYFILAKKIYKKIPKLFVACISFILGLIAFFGLSLFEVNFSLTQFIANINSDLSHISVLIASLYMAIFGSIIGLTTYIKGQENIEASEASLFIYLQPLIYLPLGIIFLKETINIWQIASLFIILTGVIMAEKRKKK